MPNVDISTIFLFAAFIGTPAFVNIFLSGVLDHIPRWVNWTDTTAKNLITLFISIALGLLSSALVNTVLPGLPPDVLAKLQSIYAIILAAFTAWSGGLVQHYVVLPWAQARRARLLARAALFKSIAKTDEIAALSPKDKDLLLATTATNYVGEGLG